MRWHIAIACVISLASCDHVFGLGPVEATKPDADLADPVGWWKLDEGSGTSIADSSEHGNDGMLQNGVTWSPGQVGPWAVSFDGVDDVANVGHAASIDNLGPLTVAAWIKPATLVATPTGGQRRIVAKESKFSGRWALVHTGSVVFVKDFATTELRVQTAGVLVQDVWQHVAATWDGSSSAAGVHMYLNGAETTYQLQQDGIGDQNVDTAVVDLLIGNDFLLSRQFVGAIDDVRVYARELSPDEIMAIVLQR